MVTPITSGTLLRGYLNSRSEPLVELALVTDQDTTLTFTIDTGTNCDLLVLSHWSEKVGWPVTDHYDDTELINGAQCSGYWTWGYVRWLGRLRQVRAFAVKTENASKKQRPKEAREDQDVFAGFIGIGLLKGTNIQITDSVIEISALPRGS